jgi:uncharacterized GH25 family protein
LTVNIRVTRLAVCLVAVLSLPLAAHDFWIEPSTFEPPVDSVVRVGLRVGPGFDAEAVVRDSQAIEAFFVAGPNGRQDVIGRDGFNPAGLFRVSAPGTLVVGYRSKPAPLKLDAAAFEKYLKEEGLERIVEARAKSGHSTADVAEVFSRSVKSVLLAGDGARDGHDRVLGLTLELIPERHPAALPADGLMPVRLLYQGKPLEGALVMALSQANKPSRQARTDRNGRVVLAVDSGVWMIKAVHMVPAPPASGADWESIWSSLTFKASTGAAATVASR